MKPLSDTMARLIIRAQSSGTRDYGYFCQGAEYSTRRAMISRGYLAEGSLSDVHVKNITTEGWEAIARRFPRYERFDDVLVRPGGEIIAILSNGNKAAIDELVRLANREIVKS